jgi:hypothetical protein
MQDLSPTLEANELPLPNLEDLQKLISKEACAEVISTCSKLTTEVVHQFLAYDQIKTGKLVSAIKKKSLQFRCANSKRLLISPVLARDGLNYEERILRAVSDQQFEGALMDKKAEAKPFCEKKLKKLLPHLKLLNLSDDLLELTAEFLSVLDAGHKLVCRVLGDLKHESIPRLACKLGDFCSSEHIISIIEKIEESLPYHALCLVRLLMQEHMGTAAFEEGFRCFVALLSKANLSEEAFDLAEEISENLRSSHFEWMIAVLGDQPINGELGLRLDRLKLRAALLKQREQANLNSGHRPDLDLKMITALEALSRENFALDEMLKTIYRLFSTDFKAQDARSQLQINALNSEVKELREALTQTILSEQAKAEQVAKHQESEAAWKQTIAKLRTDAKFMRSALARARSLIKQKSASCKELDVSLQQALIKSYTENEFF